MKRRPSAVSVVALATVIVGAGACGEDAAPPSASSTPTPSTTAPTTPDPDTEPDMTNPVPSTSSTPAPSNTAPTTPDPDTEPDMTNPVPPSSIVDRAVADLAERVSVEPQAISVVSAEEVTWPDGSLGCPEPGRSYTQALVDGTLIRLAVDGTEYEYHAGRGGEPFYCPADRATPPTEGVAPNS